MKKRITRKIFVITGIFAFIYFIRHIIVNFLSGFWNINRSNYYVNASEFVNKYFGSLFFEITFIAIPFIVHGLIGLKYMLTMKYSFHPKTHYDLLQARFFQKITAWILLIAIILHVVQLRFLNQPVRVTIDDNTYYAVKVTLSDKIYKVAKKMDFKILEKKPSQATEKNNDTILDSNKTFALVDSSSKGMLVAIINNFQSKLMTFLYSIFVLSASFHAFNGFWLFLISFKIIKTDTGRRLSLRVCMGFMFLFLMLGFYSIWANFLAIYY